MKLLGPSTLYFGIVFVCGFALGTLRVLFVVPRLGERAAELCELPLMVLASFLAARWVVARFLARRGRAAQLCVGGAALGMLIGAEFLLSMTLRGLSPREILLDRDPISGAAYALSLCLFGLMPALAGRLCEPRRIGRGERI